MFLYCVLLLAIPMFGKGISMISDDLGKALHDKATRGLPLSDGEQAQLQVWYD